MTKNAESCREYYANNRDKCTASSRRYYINNRDKIALKEKKEHQEKAKFIRRMKDKPCTDCGKCFPYYVMDFDHIRDKRKKMNMMINLGWSAIFEEIDKCDVVCSNCHRIRSYTRRVK